MSRFSLPPKRLSKITGATRLHIAATRAALNVIRRPVVEALAEAGHHITRDLDLALEQAIEQRLGRPLAHPDEILGRLTVHPDGSDKPEDQRGEVYCLDDQPLLWAGPVRLVPGVDSRGERTLQAERTLRYPKSQV